MTIVYLDTNFLLAPGQDNIQVFEEMENLLNQKPVLKTTSPVLNELKLLSKSNDKPGSAAKLALKLLEAHSVEVVDVQGPADESILSQASLEQALVATNDKALARKLRGQKLKVIAVSQHATLKLT